MHAYATGKDPVGTGRSIASWTQKMGQYQEKPNLIGEFGSSDEHNYPELAYNALWAALASGAAATPMEWNDSGSWSQMSDAMYDDIRRFSDFVFDLPLARFEPVLVSSGASDDKVQIFATGSERFAVAWAQDVSQIGKPIDEVRQNVRFLSHVTVKIGGLGKGNYRIRIYGSVERRFRGRRTAVRDR